MGWVWIWPVPSPTISPSRHTTDSRTEVTFRYAAASHAGPDGVALVGNATRDDVRLAGRLRDPVFFREAMSALYAVVGSDFRYVPKDRSAYLAFQRSNLSTV